MKTRRSVFNVPWLKAIGMAVVIVFAVVACDIPIEGETDSDVVDTEDVDTYIQTDSGDIADCEPYYVCIEECDMFDGEPNDDMIPWDICKEQCGDMWPECIEPPVLDCHEQFEMCIDECIVTSEDNPEACFMDCEMELEHCMEPPISCEERLDECIMNCEQSDHCVGTEDDDIYLCEKMDDEYFDDYFNDCINWCFMDYDMCIGYPPPPPPPINCEKEYDYCLDSCSWDDKFCHDHCYESFFYCSESMNNKCEQEYDNCTDSCAWDDKFCHDHCYESYFYCMEEQPNGTCIMYCDPAGCWEECCYTTCDSWGCWEECYSNELPPPGNLECYIFCEASSTGVEQCWERCCDIIDDTEECWETPIDIPKDTDNIVIE